MNGRLDLESNLFRDGLLGFELRKPQSWNFLPPAWSPMERLKRQPEPEEWLQLAAKPFCCAQKPHGVEGYAHPTLQATVRPFPTPPLDGLAAILQTLVANVPKVHETFELEEATSDAIVGGYPALRYSGRFQLIQAFPDGRELLIGVRSRSILVFARNLAFTIGLSGSDDANYYDESEFDSIVDSIKIR